MGISPGTVKSTTSRGLAALGRLLGGGHDRLMIEHRRAAPRRDQGRRGHGAARQRAAAAAAPRPGGPPARAGLVPGGRLRRRRLAALTPLAAAAAVIIVLAAAVAVAVAHGQPGHRAAARPRHHESLLAQLPPYYVTLEGTGQLGDATHAQVRATATGKVLATVRPPRPDTVFSQVSAAGEATNSSSWPAGGSKRLTSGVQNWFTSANKFFLLRIDPYTHVPLLSALPIPPDVVATETGFALSRDGLKLAVAREAVPEPRRPVRRSRSSTW